eukprot:gene59701-81692_t
MRLWHASLCAQRIYGQMEMLGVAGMRMDIVNTIEESRHSTQIRPSLGVSLAYFLDIYVNYTVGIINRRFLKDNVGISLRFNFNPSLNKQLYRAHTPNYNFMHFNRKHYSDETLLGLYKSILYPRMIEEKMLILLRQGKVGKWFSGIGQEAIACGVAAALHPDEYILPLHRNLGVFTGRNIPFSKLFAQWQGKKEGFTKGRDRSFHFGTN